MTVSVFPMEPARRAVWTFRVTPLAPPRVEMYGVWYPLSFTPAAGGRPGGTGVLLLCGQDVTPVLPGHVKVTGDYLPVVDVDGEFFTDEWVRSR